MPVLDRCTSLNPNDRYQSVAELIRAVDRTQKLWHIKRLAFLSALTAIIFILIQSIEFEPTIAPPPVEIDVEPTIEEEPTVEPEEELSPPNIDDAAEQLIDFVKTQRFEPTPVPLPTIEPIRPSKTDYEIEKRPAMILYINGELSPNRSPHSTAGDIDLGDEYKNWRRDGKGNYLFPADWTATLRIENHTARDIIKPRITVECSDDEIIKYILIRDINVAP